MDDVRTAFRQRNGYAYVPNVRTYRQTNDAKVLNHITIDKEVIIVYKTVTRNRGSFSIK